MPDPQPRLRYPYRAASELEDITLRQNAVVRELEVIRRAALDPKTKRYLRELEVEALAVQEWLATLRDEMRRVRIEEIERWLAALQSEAAKSGSG